jgi:hypothetical protein
MSAVYFRGWTDHHCQPVKGELTGALSIISVTYSETMQTESLAYNMNCTVLTKPLEPQVL